jgi:N-acetylglutamate synthase-like GNAT family acetyltransferase
MKVNLTDINIRTELRPGDLGEVIRLHGWLYSSEYQYGISFETYVAEGLVEFYRKYNSERNRVWVCEHNGQMIGFMLLMDRREAAQLRYFLVRPEFRGIGLGKELMELYLAFARQCGFRRSYLWTTKELSAAASLYTRHGFKLVEEKASAAFGKQVIEQRYDWQDQL